MRLTGSRAYIRPTPIPKMPTGLVELMEDLTRDVLKNNPPDVYEFCAGHMRKLLEIRDGAVSKPPLTLQQKIASAQEKVRKRGEARWQKYLNDKKNAKKDCQVKSDPNNKTYLTETGVKPSSPVVQPELKPPVYPDLNKENASEIEIFHEPGNIVDFPENATDEPDKNNIEKDNMKANINNEDIAVVLKENHDPPKFEQEANNIGKKYNEGNIKSKGISIDYEQSEDVVMTKSTGNTSVIIINDTKSKDVFVLDNKSLDEEIESKTEGEKLQNLIPIEAKSLEKTINIENKDLSSAPKIQDVVITDEMVNKSNNGILIQELPDAKVVDKSQHETEYQVGNSISDMGKLVNNAVSTLNVLNEISRSPSQDTETINGEIKTLDLEDKNNDHIQTNDEKADMSIETNTSKDSKTRFTEAHESVIKDADNKLENEQSVCPLIDISVSEKLILKEIQLATVPESILKNQNTQENKSIDSNNKKQENSDTYNNEDNITDTVSIGKDLKVDIFNMNNDSNKNISKKLIEEEKNTSDYVIETSHILVNDNHHNVKLSTQPESFKYVDASLASDGVKFLHSEKPLVNIANIHETSNVEDGPNEGNIEIRVSQVAEVLNNDVPLSNDIVTRIEESGMSNLSLHTEINPEIYNSENVPEGTKCTEKQNEGQLISNLEIIDNTPSTNMLGNIDHVYNVDITNVTKSTSIDDSTDEMDNTSLIESGTSEGATDDTSQYNENSNNMDLETAAVTIQKVFRSFLFKSRASTFDDNDENISLDDDNEKKDELEFKIANDNINKERRGVSRMDTVLQTVNEEKSLSLSTDDSSTLSSAATTIQAHVRGFLVRNKLHSNKTASTNSLVNSDGHDDCDIAQKNNKTILNIHIVPEGGNYLSRDESTLTSMDLSLDDSPPSSLNLHPLGYDKNERRKQLKREDAIQSISPPSNNSGKLSEDSVKDMLITEGDHQTREKDDKDDAGKNNNMQNRPGSADTSPTNSLTIETVIEAHKLVDQESSDPETETSVKNAKPPLTKQSSDEMDVVTPFEDKNSLADSNSTSKMMHSSEFHDIVLPTNVSRSDASVVSEFKNVLVYFLAWNNS